MSGDGAGAGNGAAGGGAEFEKGDQVLYTSNSGVIELGVILNIHYDDTPPYYTIRLLRTNHEKVTDAKNLTLLSQEDQEEEWEDGEENRNQEISPRDEKSINPTETDPESSSINMSQSNSSQWMVWIATTGLLVSLGIFFSFKVSQRFQKSLSTETTAVRLVFGSN